MNKDFDNLDGSVDLYDSVTAETPVSNRYFDSENFYPADGDYLNAGGFLSGTIFDKKERARRRSLREDRKQQRQDRRSQRTSSKADARKTKAGAKLTAAQGQKIASQGLSKESQADVELAKALGKSGPEEKPGMSTTTKVLIGVGIFAVLAIGGYIAYKKFGNKGSVNK